MVRHCSNMDGKAAERAGKSEDLSGQMASKPLNNANCIGFELPAWTEDALLDLEDKNGTSPDRLNFGPGIFFPGPKKTFFGKGGK